jgi:hypothetical protein
MNRLVNTAVISGVAALIPMHIFAIDHGGNIHDVTMMSRCRSTAAADVIKVGDDHLRVTPFIDW